MRKRYIVIGALAVMVMGAAAAVAGKPAEGTGSRAGGGDPVTGYSNLKVLPKNVSSRILQGIMVDDFDDGLGVTCGFCHAPAKDGHGLDFASDAKPEKRTAREMMRMTLGLNKKYLKVHKPFIGGESMIVTCGTCHRGEAMPVGH